MTVPAWVGVIIVAAILVAAPVVDVLLDARKLWRERRARDAEFQRVRELIKGATFGGTPGDP